MQLGQTGTDLDQGQQGERRDQIDQQAPRSGIVLDQGTEHQHAQQGDSERLGRPGVEVQQITGGKGKTEIDQPCGDRPGSVVAVPARASADSLFHEVQDSHARQPRPGEGRTHDRQGRDKHDGGVEQTGGLQSGGGVDPLPEKVQDPLGGSFGHQQRGPLVLNGLAWHRPDSRFSDPDPCLSA